jgi:sigma-B regulation protein RsbU (phosphoserine phosphatase)
MIVGAGHALPSHGDWLGDADDFVSATLGAEGIAARARAILRFRGCLLELGRKNAELEALSARLEVLARRMADELRLAQRVQRSLLPPPLQDPRLDVARELIPFREVGGDYYDLLPLGPDRLAFAVGDVMGKGVPAALMASNLKAALRAQLQWGEWAPEEVVSRVNRLFCEVTPGGLFASLFFAVLDLAEGRLDYVNAGHDYPLRVSPCGSIEELREGGAVLGLAEASAYARGRLELRRDDLFVFYSDGVTDRANVHGEMYGLERLKEAALRSRGDAARIALYTLLGEAQGWAEGRPADDDMTLVVMRVR